MNCRELGALLCDYTDGTLDAGVMAEVERHLEECPECMEAAREAAAVVAFLEAAEKVEPPPELVTRIVFNLTGGRPQPERRRWSVTASMRRLIEPILQPRFAMGMAMTILSFSMLARLAGINVRQLSVEDVDPVKVWRAFDDRAHRTWNRAVKFCDNLRSVYEIRTRLRQLAEEDESGRSAEPAAPAEQPGTAAGAHGRTDSSSKPNSPGRESR
jgi:anti-sigma factor RsiW